MLKKIIIGLVVLVVVLGVGAAFLWNNLDYIIRSAVEKYGTAATQASVTLDSVNLSLTSGAGSLGGLAVGSPSGFSSKQSMYLGSIKVQVELSSIRGSGPIVIDQIAIEKPQITYEMNNSGDSNLQTLARNAQNYAAQMSGPQQKQAQGSAASSSSGQGRKVIIKDLSVTSAQVSISQQMLKGKQLSAGLPDIHMTNIGQGTGGVTPAEVAHELIGKLTSEAGEVATGDLLKQLGSLKDLGGAAGDAINGAGTTGVGKATDTIKGLLGQ